jgi:hypothetical protein
VGVRDAGAHGTGLHDRRWDVWTIAALLVVTIIGAVIRAKGFAHTGLVPDDAWVALSSRVGLGTAWHMWVTAPGFGFVERTWMVLGPSTTWWYQLPAFVCGVAAVPAIFCLARYFKLGRCSALALAVVVCASPTCVTYSTRVKEYPVDLLLSCLLIALAEAARRRPAREPLLAFAVASVGAFVVSASVGVLVVALWAALVVAAVRHRPAPWRVLVVGVATAAVCGIVAAVFYAHLSPTLTRFWTTNGAFIEHSSLHRFASSSIDSAFRLIADLLWASTQAPSLSAFGLLIVVVWAGLSLIALRRDPAMLGPALAVLVAFVASAAQFAPLGTGRTDEYLYPPLLLLAAAGARQLLAPAGAALVPSSTTAVRMATIVALGLVSVLAAGALMQHAYSNARAYPGADLPALATELHRDEVPGDHVFVDEVTRYPWAFYEDTPLRLEFGSDWSTGFTVMSTDRNVFIAPSEDYEGGAQLARWADDMAAYRRLWYVWTKPRSQFSASYEVFLRDGWRPVQTIQAPGCGATLLVRAADAGDGLDERSLPAPITGPATQVLVPSGGATLSGKKLIDASATDNVRVTKVEFQLTGGQLRSSFIAVATQTYVGWVSYWKTTNITNGTYSLQSVAIDTKGRRAYSKGVTIEVNNK